MSGQGDAPRLFGTNGIRGVVNTEEMDCDLAIGIGMAVGTFMDGPVLIGTDARTSNQMLKSACAAGIMASGNDVLDCGVVPTPTLQYAVKNNEVGGGVMITASHNPPEFNGIKCVDPDGTEMARENEAAIERILHERRFKRAGWSDIGRLQMHDTAVRDYLDGIMANLDLDAIASAGLKVALDCGNGAGCGVTPRLLEELGVGYVTLNANPNGAFPGHNSEPTPDNAEDLIQFVKHGDFDLGIIHDGDADRTIFVDEGGSYMYGDRSLAIAAYHACLANDGGLVVTTVGSSKCVDDAVEMGGGRVMHTKVGSPVVARAMKEHGAVFGGEENGGLIFPELQYCRDGAMAAAKLIEIVAKHGKMSVINGKIPAYSQYKTKTPCPNDRKQHVLEELERTAKAARADRTDGLKLFFDDGWVLIRPSGTEPIFRVFSEASNPERARDIAESYKKNVADLVEG